MKDESTPRICPLSDRTVEQRFITIQTTIIVLGIFVHTIVLAVVGNVLRHQFEDVRPADVLRNVQMVQTEQKQQYESILRKLEPIDEDR